VRAKVCPSLGPSRETTGLGWLQKTPLVSLLFAVAIAAVPFLLVDESPGVGARFDNAREEARAWFERNPQLEVDSVGALILDPVWLDEALATAAEREAESASDVRLPPRLLARSQAHLDGLIEDARDARMVADPAWRLGVLDAQTPRRNYVAHAFVHDAMPAVVLCVAVLLLVGAPLERTWGSPVFTLFVLSAIPFSAQAYRMLDASSGVPWSGGTGLAAALLGAYFIRGLGGHFMLPGWILLPAWIATEAFVLRGFWLDDLGSVPWATLCAAVGFGAASASVLRLMNVEARLDGVGAGRRRRGPNPAVARAARMRSDGDPYQAFDLIQAAWRDDPSDIDVREAFFSIAVEVGQPEAAADAILPSLQSALRKGEFSRAVDYWFPLAAKQVDVALEPTAFVRLGEALLDAGHPEEALYSLRGAIDAGVSSAGAARIVNIARDLDPELTRTAAHIALADPTIEGNLRAELERLVATASDGQAPTPSPAAPEPSRSQLDRRVHAEHQTVETTAFPLELDTDVDTLATTAARADADANEAALAAQDLDGGALSAESLAADAHDDGDPAAESDDVLSHWNDQGALDADTLSDVSAALDDAEAEEGLLEADDLEMPDSGFDFGVRSGGADEVDPFEDETDSDLTPLMDATDELTSPLEGEDGEDTSTAVFGEAKPTASVAGDDAATVCFEAPSDQAEDATAYFEAPSGDADAHTAYFDPAADAHTAYFDPAADDATPVAPTVAEDDAPTTLFEAPPTPSPSPTPPASGEPVTTIMTLRPIKAVDAVPVGASDEWIEIDAEGRGKSKLPLARIDAIAMGAVDGLGPRPVLVIDFVLNWGGDASEPIKSIRVRSDRFDPLAFASDAANPLGALTRWVASIEAQSGATLLPTREILTGRFARFEDVAAYARDVLMAEA